MKALVNLLFCLLIVFAVFGCSLQTSKAPKTDTSTSSALTDQQLTRGDHYIYDTITVAAGTTYDGYGETIIAVGMGDGSQSEGQKYIFRLENGANLKNVNIANPGCGGINCYGNNVISNVNWLDVGEDALTVSGSGNITINGGYANYAADKVFQINAACTLNINNFSSNYLHTFIRQNGGTTWTFNTFLNGVTLDYHNEAIAVWRTDSSTSKVFYNNLSVSNFNGSHGWWYDRASQSRAMSDPIKLSNVTTSMCIDGMGYTSNGSNACQWSSSSSNNQRWKLWSTDAYVMIQNASTGLYLDGMGRTTNGDICGQWSGSSSSNQQWMMITTGTSVKFKNRGTGLAIDGMGSTTNGSNLCQWSDSDHNNKKWYIVF